MSSSQAIIDVLTQLNKIPINGIETSAKLRKEAIVLSKKLTTVLEPPENRATDLMFTHYLTIAARIAIDLNLFHLLSSTSTPQSTASLSKSTNAEALLLTRLLRLLAAESFLDEIAPDLWAANPTTKAMTGPIAAGHRMVYDIVMPGARLAPEYFRERGYASPTDPRDGFVQSALDIKVSTFEYIFADPKLRADFNEFMGNTMGSREYWYDWYPIEQRLLTGLDTDPNSVLLVDVGGGKGHDLQSFHRKFPSHPGRLVLQDLPHAIDSINPTDLDPSIERHVHDFYTPQPIQGARAYFLHHILHDWPDKIALRILGHLRAAMRPGYSKLLIHDLVLPDQKASAYQCVWDMHMFFATGAIERSRSQWEGLLVSAGFEVVGFWGEDADADGLVEAVVRLDGDVEF